MGSKSSKTDMTTEGMLENSIPDDILAEIFLRLPGLDVVKSCLCVCKDWYNVGNTQTLWKDKCARDLHFSQDMLRLLAGEDFKVLYFKNPYGKNLIRNPDASQGLKEWNEIVNGGDGWRVEKEPCGADPVENYSENIPQHTKAHSYEHFGPTVGCWSTSYHTCKKKQRIDLVKNGCSSKVLDELKPNINVSEWYAARFDCGIKYRLEVKLLGADNKTVLDKYEVEDVKPAGRAWFQVSNTFTGYPSGVRFVEFEHFGEDTQFWKGHFGAKMTLATVSHVFSKYPEGVRFIQYVHGGKDTQFWAGHFGAKITLSTVKLDILHDSVTSASK